MTDVRLWLPGAALTAAALTSFPRTADAISCASGPYMVFFDAGGDELSEPAQRILDNALSSYGTCGGGGSIRIAGHADRSGPALHNILLSKRRSDRVRAYLTGRGLPDDAIFIRWFGEGRPLVETADDVQKAENRRVEITFGPPKGW